MEKFRIPLLAVALFLAFTSKAEKCTSLHEQLRGLNKYWSLVESSEYLQQEYPLLNEKALIQLHLFLIKDMLSNKSSNLSTLQQKRRNNLLIELEEYAQQGVFPKNSYHTSRTPYFIDDVGTACAVGNLIIQSGQEELSLTIAEEFNYEYIEDMPQEKISSWANNYGFTVDELKWIQPGYGPSCSPGQVIQPTCKGGTGCFNPDWQSDGLIAPITYFSEFNDGTGWVVDSTNIWQFWGGRIGQHRITVTDSINASVVYQYTINDVPAIPLQAIVTDQTSASYCNGQVILNVNDTSGTIYYYELQNMQLNYFKSGTNVFDSLCTGTYTARVNNSSNCSHSIIVTVNNSTGLSQNDLSQHVKIQTPFQRYLNINTSLTGNKTVKIYSIQGALVYDSIIHSNKPLDLVGLKNGLYVVQIEFDGSIYSRKVVKAN